MGTNDKGISRRTEKGNRADPPTIQLAKCINRVRSAGGFAVVISSIPARRRRGRGRDGGGACWRNNAHCRTNKGARRTRKSNGTINRYHQGKCRSHDGLAQPHNDHKQGGARRFRFRVTSILRRHGFIRCFGIAIDRRGGINRVCSNQIPPCRFRWNNAWASCSLAAAEPEPAGRGAQAAGAGGFFGNLFGGRRGRRRRRSNEPNRRRRRAAERAGAALAGLLTRSRIYSAGAGQRRFLHPYRAGSRAGISPLTF